MFPYFIIAFGAAVAVNAFVSSCSKHQALRLTAFLLAIDFGASIAIQTWTVPPARPLWWCFLNFLIMIIFVVNRREYKAFPFLRTVIPLGYLVMIGLNVLILATYGGTELLVGYVADVIFLTILGANLVGGVRDGWVRLGSGNIGRSRDLHHSHSRPVVRK